MSQASATRWETIKGLLFQLFPHHLISRITFWATRQRWPFVRFAIKQFIKFFKVEMHDAEVKDLADYATFNAFFTRELEPGARPIEQDENLLGAPCDGRISQFGVIDQTTIIQAKGKYFSVDEFLTPACQNRAAFENGNFCTLYLSPRDYHRVHMAYAAQLIEMVYVPGRLFSVAPYAPKTIDKLYARNERVACIFKTCHGYMATVMVGAVNVAAIETVWAGLITPPHLDHPIQHNYQQHNIQLDKGAHMGTFNMGSTVVMLYAKNFGVALDSLAIDQRVLMGEKIAYAQIAQA